LPHCNPDWFYLSGTGLRGLSGKEAVKRVYIYLRLGDTVAGQLHDGVVAATDRPLDVVETDLDRSAAAQPVFRHRGHTSSDHQQPANERYRIFGTANRPRNGRLRPQPMIWPVAFETTSNLPPFGNNMTTYPNKSTK